VDIAVAVLDPPDKVSSTYITLSLDGAVSGVGLMPVILMFAELEGD